MLLLNNNHNVLQSFKAITLEPKHYDQKFVTDECA